MGVARGSLDPRASFRRSLRPGIRGVRPCCRGVEQAAATVANTNPEPTIVKELPSLRTANSDTYLRSDGTRSQRIYSHPINYSVGGAWHPIEDQLARSEDGSWHPVASPVPIRLPSALGSGSVAVGPTNEQISFALEGAGTTEGSATSARRTYANVFPDVSASYLASPDSVRETLALYSASAPTVYRYKLSLSPGLSASLSSNGGLVVKDASGKRVYWLGAPTVTDPSKQRTFRSRQPVHYELSSDGSTLSLIVDKSWLQSPKRVFPVEIDPEVYFDEGEDCAIVSNTNANYDECGSNLYIGTNFESPRDVGRALLHFDLSCVPRGSNILRSRLELWPGWHVGEDTLDIEAFALKKALTKK